MAIAGNKITRAKIDADAIDGTKVADDSLDSEHYAATSIDNEHLADNAVGTDEIADDAVTYAKIQNVSATDRILGRDSASAGVIEEITPANVRTMINVADGANAYVHPNHSGEVTSTADGATVIADNIVDEANLKVSNAPSNGYMLTAQSGDTGGLTWAEAGGTSNATTRNLIINGGMEVAQKGGGSHTTAAQTYWVDRFYTYCASAGKTFSHSSNGPDGFQHSLKIQRDASNSSTNPVYLSQPAESASSVGFAGSKITLSFYARKGANFSPTSDFINVAVYSGTGTDQSMMAGLTGSTAVIGTTNQALTADWTRYTFTSGSVVPTNSTQLVFQILHSPTGTAGANDWYEITGVQIEKGESATDFVHEEFGTTLAKCQRFFLNYVQGDDKSIGVAGFYNTTTVAQHHQPPSTFREAPSFAFGSGSDWYYVDRNGGAVTGNLTAGSWMQINSVGFYGNSFGSSTGGHVCFMRTNNSGAYIWWDAEI